MELVQSNAMMLLIFCYCLRFAETLKAYEIGGSGTLRSLLLAFFCALGILLVLFGSVISNDLFASSTSIVLHVADRVRSLCCLNRRCHFLDLSKQIRP